MHEKCIEFVVEYCKPSCPTWAHCISTAVGFENGDKRDSEDLLFCLKCTEYKVQGIEKTEEEIELEVATIMEGK